MNKNTNEKDVMSFREKMKDKKYSAKVQLIGYGIFILVVILYANISSKNYNYDYANKITNSVSDLDNNGELVTDKSLLDTINNNYEYDIKVDITNDKDEVVSYQYTGASYEDILSIKTNDKIYFLKSNEYYEEVDDNYKIIDNKDIYGKLDSKYIELEEILDYLDAASLDRTTDFSSGEVVSTYYLYLKNMLPNYHEDDYVEFNISEKDSVLSIEIDYSNLMNYKDKTIKKYKVVVNYTNIGNVEEFGIETNTTEVE